MKRIVLVLLFVTALALVIGCSSPSAEWIPMTGVIPAQPPPAVPYGASEAYGSGGDTNSTVTGKARESDSSVLGSAQQAEERMIVYNGSVSLQVDDTAKTIDAIQGILKNVNGYIASRSLQAYGKDKLRGEIVIRIPAATLDTTLAQIKALGLRVLTENASSNDVTAEYVDLEARRKNLEAYEVELTQLLDTVRERTGKAEDILAVYNQLTQVRGEIDQIHGRQNYLQNTSTLATYTIEMVPVEEVVVEGTPGWDPGRTAGQALDRLVTTLQALADLAIILAVTVLPVLLILAIPIVILFFIVRAIARRRSPKKPMPAS